MIDDETTGHVDNLCCFARPGEVILTWTDNKRDPQYQVSQDAYERLMEARDAQGRRLKVHKLHSARAVEAHRMQRRSMSMWPMRARPRARLANGLAGSYVSFYMGNSTIVMPLLDPKQDGAATRYVAEDFPGSPDHRRAGARDPARRRQHSLHHSAGAGPQRYGLRRGSDQWRLHASARRPSNENLPTLRDELLDLQLKLHTSKSCAVAVIIAGTPAAGRSETVNELLEWLDPKHIGVHALGAPSAEDRKFPPLWRYWRRLPARGRMTFFFAGWYGEYLGGVIKDSHAKHARQALGRADPAAREDAGARRRARREDLSAHRS